MGKRQIEPEPEGHMVGSVPCLAGEGCHFGGCIFHGQ